MHIANYANIIIISVIKKFIINKVKLRNFKFEE